MKYLKVPLKHLIENEQTEERISIILQDAKSGTIPQWCHNPEEITVEEEK